ncbi:MAG: hypothetical protein ACO3UL_08590 [Flavobacteriaceae bacterium]
MGSLLRTGDFLYALRFLRLLTTPWKKTTAFKLGILDENGKVIRKPETAEEKGAYNIFHKLVFNLKRLLNKIPFGKSTIASYAAALFLIREYTDISDRALGKILYEVTGVNPNKIAIEKSDWFLTEDKSKIQAGTYTLLRDIALPRTGDLYARERSLIDIKEHKPVGHIFGYDIYEATHIRTQQKIYISQEDITR